VVVVVAPTGSCLESVVVSVSLDYSQRDRLVTDCHTRTGGSLYHITPDAGDLSTAFPSHKTEPMKIDKLYE
jgi:hypothetical protein